MPKSDGKLPKPNMKGFLKRQIAVNVSVALALGALAGVAYKFFVVEPRKKRYADFYRNYDPEEAFNNMISWGADFQSVSSPKHDSDE